MPWTRGNTKQGMSQGFPPQRKSSTHIILPQAIRKMLPAIISQFVTVIRDTSLVSTLLSPYKNSLEPAKFSWAVISNQSGSSVCIS